MLPVTDYENKKPYSSRFFSYPPHISKTQENRDMQKALIFPG